MAGLVGCHAAARLGELLASFRVVVLGGARQTGKTTLVSELIELPPGSRFSLDDEDALRAATEDPRGFVDALPTPAAVDEFQRAGRGFLLAAKRRVDRDRSRGQLLLTGSANYLADRSISETLAGRAGRLVLSPLSAGERRGIRETFVDHLFEPESWPGPRLPSPNRPDLIDWLLEGGCPEVVTERLRGRRRRDWFEAYVGDVVSREALRPMADVRMESELRRLLRLLAARTAQELVISDVASDAELSRQTAANYLSLLEALPGGADPGLVQQRYDEGPAHRAHRRDRGQAHRDADSTRWPAPGDAAGPTGRAVQRGSRGARW
ncbi:MAG: ATP-binding protein [Pseudonocardiaceae bacterium]